MAASIVGLVAAVNEMAIAMAPSGPEEDLVDQLLGGVQAAVDLLNLGSLGDTVVSVSEKAASLVVWLSQVGWPALVSAIPAIFFRNDTASETDPTSPGFLFANVTNVTSASLVSATEVKEISRRQLAVAAESVSRSTPHDIRVLRSKSSSHLMPGWIPP